MRAVLVGALLSALWACGDQGAHVAVDASLDTSIGDAAPSDASADAQADASGPDACVPATWHHDGDGDGFGDPAQTMSTCIQPSGYVADATDCDDTRAGVNPGAQEV